MAKFKPILGELSGKVAGNVFAHNKGGPYVRVHSVPTNRNSAIQQAVRATLASTSALWQGLSDSVRSQWSSYALMNVVNDSLGNPVLLTGQQAYCGLNARLAVLGVAPITAPPVTLNTATLGTCSVTLTAPATVAVTFSGTPLAAGHRMELLLSPPGTAGRDPNLRTARHAGTSAAAATSVITFASSRAFVAGQTVNCWVRDIDAYGQPTVPQKLRAVAG